MNRGSLCPKGAGLLDFVHSKNRLKYPEVREPGSKEWKRIGWDEAFTRIAKLVKEDRDANFIAKNADGVTVEPLAHHRLPRRLRLQQRSRLHHPQGGAQPGNARLRQPSACLTRPDGGKSCPDVWPWRHDQSLVRHQECGRGADHGRQRCRSPSLRLQMGDRSEGENKARLIVVDPRFTRSAALADLYAPIRTGTDIAFLGGVINYLIAGNKVHHGLHQVLLPT